MSRYRLQDCGYPTYKKIVTGRKWIGRVCKVPGGYLGIIGKTEFKAATERQAFDEVVSRHLGFSSSSALDQHNRQVRAVNSENRAIGRYAGQQALAGNFDPLFDLFKGK